MDRNLPEQVLADRRLRGGDFILFRVEIALGGLAQIIAENVAGQLQRQRAAGEQALVIDEASRIAAGRQDHAVLAGPVIAAVGRGRILGEEAEAAA